MGPFREGSVPSFASERGGGAEPPKQGSTREQRTTGAPWCRLRGICGATSMAGRGKTSDKYDAPEKEERKTANFRLGGSTLDNTRFDPSVEWCEARVTKPFGELFMSVLAEACSRGDHESVRRHLKEIQQGEAIGSGANMEAELTAVDDWAGSSSLHWAAYSGERCGARPPRPARQLMFS
eukprot:671438-Prymnesium_polylepis.1